MDQVITAISEPMSKDELLYDILTKLRDLAQSPEVGTPQVLSEATVQVVRALNTLAYETEHSLVTNKIATIFSSLPQTIQEMNIDVVRSQVRREVEAEWASLKERWELDMQGLREELRLTKNQAQALQDTNTNFYNQAEHAAKGEQQLEQNRAEIKATKKARGLLPPDAK